MLPNRLFGFCILRCAKSCCLTRRGGLVAEEPGKGRRGSRRTRRVRIGQFNHVRRVACRAQAGRCGRSTTRCCLRRRATARASAAARHRARSPALPLAGGDSIESAIGSLDARPPLLEPDIVGRSCLVPRARHSRLAPSIQALTSARVVNSRRPRRLSRNLGIVGRTPATRCHSTRRSPGRAALERAGPGALIAFGLSDDRRLVLTVFILVVFLVFVIIVVGVSWRRCIAHDRNERPVDPPSGNGFEGVRVHVGSCWMWRHSQPRDVGRRPCLAGGTAREGLV